MKHLKSIISLTSICAVMALLLALTNYITAPIIEKQQAAAANEALLIVYPNGESFEAVDLSAKQLPETITEAYKEASGGYVLKMTTTGYGSGLVIMCGIDKDGNVTGATCLESNETLSEEKTYGETLVGATAETIETIDTVAGATMTTGAYRSAVKDALNAFTILNGGSVDLRSEEEILADTLSEVLPAAEGKFTAKFITEDLKDISAVYEADNGAGFVFLSGETYVATDKDGKVISEATADIKKLIESQAKKLISATMEEIDISSYADMPSQVEKAYKTSSGNYVFDLKAAGFGINGDAYYAPSGEYIKIKVSATAKGKIIACETISQAETDGIGSACADASFYTQFNGKKESNYSEIDAISGATITTNGYKTAISKVFEAVKMLEGDA